MTTESISARPISEHEALQHARDAGFRGEALITIVAIAHAESELVPNARLVNVDGSTDRGILQINDRWHSEVSTACADNPACAFRAGFTISSGGTNFNPWVTYQKGMHVRFLEQVRAACEAAWKVRFVNFTVQPQKDGKPVQAFDGPDTHLTVLRGVTDEPRLVCDAWIYGEPRMDVTIHRQDTRWYHLTSGGWVASARVLGNAPHSQPAA